MKVRSKALVAHRKSVEAAHADAKRDAKKLQTAQRADAKRALPDDASEPEWADPVVHPGVPVEVPEWTARRNDTDAAQVTPGGLIAMPGDWVLTHSDNLIVVHDDDMKPHWEETT